MPRYRVGKTSKRGALGYGLCHVALTLALSAAWWAVGPSSLGLAIALAVMGSMLAVEAIRFVRRNDEFELSVGAELDSYVSS